MRALKDRNTGPTEAITIYPDCASLCNVEHHERSKVVRDFVAQLDKPYKISHQNLV